MKPNANNAKYAILFIWIVLALKLASFASNLIQHGLPQAAQSSTFFIFKVVEVKVRANTESIIDILLLITFAIASVASVVFFLRWFKTAYHNLRQKIRYAGYSEGWAIGSWFIPILNIFMPYQIMKEIYMETEDFLIDRGYKIGRKLTLSYVGWWWALWILSGIRISFSPPSGILAVIAAIVGNVVFILIALVTIKVIKDYARIEPLLQQIDNPPPHVQPSLVP